MLSNKICRTAVLICTVATLLFLGCGTESPTGVEKLTDATLSPASLAKKAPSLTCTIEYVFVGHFGKTDAEGRLLVWDGEIDGDIEGQILRK